MEKAIDILSIDFGTTNSVVCISRQGLALPVPNRDREGNNQFPSYVEYTKGNINTGYVAKNNFGRAKHFVVAAVKRILGLTYEEYMMIQNKSIFGCQVVRGEDGYPRFVIDEYGRQVTPLEVAGELFKVLKKAADAFGNIDYRKAYITIPANFKDHQIRAIRSAAASVGIEVQKFIVEPTAAVMSWCLDNIDLIKPGENMVVYDFGGGTFDVSHVRFKGGREFEVMDTHGDPELGGNDIDSYMMEYLLRKCVNESPEHVNITLNDISPSKAIKYRTECEQIKIIMTNSAQYDNNEDSYMAKNAGVLQTIDMDNFSKKLAEVTIEIHVGDIAKVCKSAVDQSMTITGELLRKSNLLPGNIRLFFLVGGSSNLHYIQQSIKKRFNNARFPIINPDEAVAIGAMKLIMNDQFIVNQKIVSSYGLLSGKDDVVLILKKGDKIPIESKEFKFTNEVDYQQAFECFVYQWSGDPEQLSHPNHIYQVKKSLCTNIGTFRFKNPYPVPAREQEVFVKFSLSTGETLEVVCRDGKTNTYLSKTILRGNYIPK